MRSPWTTFGLAVLALLAAALAPRLRADVAAPHPDGGMSRMDDSTEDTCFRWGSLECCMLDEKGLP
jgi:hypothetical protein